jgi:hypothetical protein
MWHILDNIKMLKILMISVNFVIIDAEILSIHTLKQGYTNPGCQVT